MIDEKHSETLDESILKLEPGSKRPWHRIENEGKEAFDAFHVYLNFGVKRSIAKASKKVGKHYNLLYRWSRQWSWVKRAEAYDRHMAERRQKIWDAERDKMNLRQARTAVSAAAAAIETLKDYIKSEDNPEPAKMHVSSAIKLLETATRIERLARGEPDSITKNKEEITLKDGNQARDDLRKLINNEKGREYLQEISRLIDSDG